MKKLALAAALCAAFTGSAFAQSSVTLYGRVNTSVEYQDNGITKRTVENNNASRWGLKGSEDLGGGLSAFFELESGFASDTGSASNGGGTFNREAFVGVKSASLGQIKLGRITSALYYSTLDWIGVFNHDTGTTSEDNLYGLYYAGSTRSVGVTADNAVEYTSPSFGPVSFVLTASAGEGTTDKTYEGVVNYDQGDLHIGAGYSETKNPADQKLIQLFSAAASYAFGPLLVGLAYENDKAPALNLGKRDSVTATAQYTLGASEFHVSIGYAGKWDNVPDSDALQYTLGYNYNLSKRTKVYAFYYSIDNNKFAYGPGLADQTFSSIGLGIRHNF